MTLFDVAKKNVVRNFKSYLIYFVSMIFTVVIYYTFVSLRYSREIRESMQSSQSLASVFTGASVVLILFAAVFVWYSNSFFTRKRKKEAGLYSLLGIRKKSIGKMLFYENLIIGAAALGAGVALGTLLSKMFAMIFLRLLDSAVVVSFSISMQAIVNTVVVFMAMILFTSFQAYRLIYRFKLIELFQADKAGEQAPKSSLPAAIMAVLLLAFGYWLAFQPIVTSEQMLKNLGLFLCALIVGTYLLFRAAVVQLLWVSRSNKSRYYRGINMIATSGLLFRIKGNTRTLTVIALLSALTLSAGGVGYSMYYSNGENAAEAAPFSYSYVSQGEAFDRQIRGILARDKEHPITAELDMPVVAIEGDAADLPYIPSGFPPGDMPFKVISVSSYNKASRALGRDMEVKLSGDEAAAVRPRYTSDLAPSDYIGRSLAFDLQQGKREAKLTGLLEGRVLRWSYPDLAVVVSDERFDEIAADSAPMIYKMFKVENPHTAKAVSEQLLALAPEAAQMATYYAVYREGLEDAALNIFILGFLGLVFLAATGSVIYFKQLTEAHSDKERYAILRKIGVSRKEIRIAVAKQSFFVFALPMAVGILHSAMILRALAGVNLIVGSLTVPIVTAMGAYALIYLFYYVLTLNSFNKIVNP